MDLSRITEYTEHGTPYDNQRSLLPNNNFFPQSNEQPNVYANLDQTNGSLNYKLVCFNSYFIFERVKQARVTLKHAVTL